MFSYRKQFSNKKLSRKNTLNAISMMFLLAAIITSFNKQALAQFTFTGDYDKTFASPNGYYVDPQDVDSTINGENTGLYTGGILPNGSIIAGGGLSYATFGNGNGNDFYIKKFTPSGAIDTSFGSGAGFVRTDFFSRIPGAHPQAQNTQPSLDYPDILKIQPDGKILFAGSCDISRPDNGSTFGVGRDFCLIRYNADGSLDQTFGNNTIVYGGPGQTYAFQIGAGKVWTQTGIYNDGNKYGTGGFAYDMAIQPDGKIIIAGETRNYNDFFSARGQAGIIVRYNADGSLDTSFGDGGIVRFEGPNTGTSGSPCYINRRFYGVTVQPDGRIIAVGNDGVTNSGSCFQGTVFLVTRWTADGQLETALRLDNSNNVGSAEKAVAALLVPDNKVIVSGSYLGKATMVRLNLSDLSIDNTFGTNGIVGYSSANPTLYLKAIQPDGKLIGVDDAFISGNGVVRFNSDGFGDQSFGNASWDGTAPRGRLNVNQTLPNGVVGRGAAGDILIRSNGRINLLGSVGGNCPPHLCRGYVSQQNTTLTGTFTVSVPNGTNVSAIVNDVGVTFSNVSATGELTTTTIDPNSAGAPPSGYTIPPEAPAYDITTTAAYTPPVDVCIVVPNVNDQNEFAKLHLLHGENGVLVDRTISQNFTTRTVCARVDSLSPFVIAVGPAIVTASSVSISGKVLTSLGKGIAKAKISLTDETGNTRTAITNRRGFYHLEGVEAGRTYVLTVKSRRYNFENNSIVVSVNENLDDLDFTASQ